jgi:hypothetical protein
MIANLLKPTRKSFLKAQKKVGIDLEKELEHISVLRFEKKTFIEAYQVHSICWLHIY